MGPVGRTGVKLRGPCSDIDGISAPFPHAGNGRRQVLVWPRVRSSPMLEGAKKDKGHVSPNWDFKYDLIDGVRLKDVRNIVTKNGITRELYRPDWKITEGTVQHMIHVTLNGKAVSAWHMHEVQTDHIFVLTGQVMLA